MNRNRACMTFIGDKVFMLFDGDISYEMKHFIDSEKYTHKRRFKAPDSIAPRIFTVIDISKDRESRLESIFNACIDEGILILCRYRFKLGFDTNYMDYICN